MKIIFKFSILFNVILVGGLAFVILDRLRETQVPALVPPVVEPPAQAVANPAPPPAAGVPPSFHWSQLDSGDNYRDFIANLRAIGCPENTIADIVRGNVGRAFAWKRSQLKIDGSGNGPWSRSSETELAGSLLGNPPAIETTSPRSAGNHAPAGISQVAAEGNAADIISPNGNEMAGAVGLSRNGQAAGYPSFFPGENRTTDLAANQQSGNASGKQDSNGINEPAHNADGFEPQTATPASFNPGDSSNPGTLSAESPDASSGPTGPPDPLGANDPLAKSAQDIQNTEINKYNDWFAPQVAANASDGTLGIDLTDYDPN
jgi:hypothetical protein